MSKVNNLSRVRRILKNLPDSVRADIAEALDLAGRDALLGMQRATPKKTGKAAASLRMTLNRRSLALKVGQFKSRAKGFPWYWRILNFGRKAQVVIARRGATRYNMRVGALSPNPIKNREQIKLRYRLRLRLSQVFSRSLRRG